MNARTEERLADLEATVAYMLSRLEDIPPGEVLRDALGDLLLIDERTLRLNEGLNATAVTVMKHTHAIERHAIGLRAQRDGLDALAIDIDALGGRVEALEDEDAPIPEEATSEYDEGAQKRHDDLLYRLHRKLFTAREAGASADWVGGAQAVIVWVKEARP